MRNRIATVLAAAAFRLSTETFVRVGKTTSVLVGGRRDGKPNVPTFIYDRSIGFVGKNEPVSEENTMLGGKIGSCVSRKRPLEGGRLISVPVLNGLENVYLVREGLIAVLDGDVVLEPSCYEVDAAAGTIRLKRPPYADLRLLVE